MAHALHLRASAAVAGVEPTAPFVLKCVMNCDARLLAAVLSDGRVRLFDLPSLGHVGDLRPDAAPTSPSPVLPGGAPTTLLSRRPLVRDVCFVDSDPSKLWVASDDGAIMCWDVRTGGAVRRYHRPDGPAGSSRRDRTRCGPFAVAASPDGTVLAAGVANEVHLWDTRVPTGGAAGGGGGVLGVYPSSHAPEPPTYGTVRALLWHPTVRHALLSGGDDGLVCVFDTSIRRGEDDALVACMNVGSAVASMGLAGPGGAVLWVLTELDGLSLWNVGSAARLADFPALKMQFLEAGLPVAYLLCCRYDAPPPTSTSTSTSSAAAAAAAAAAASGALVLVGGDHDGGLVLFDVTPTSVTLRGGSFVAGPAGGAPVASHRNTVRGAAWAWVSGAGGPVPGAVLVTGDEDGRVCQWADAPASAALAAASSPGAPAAAWLRESDHARLPGLSVVPVEDAAGLRVRVWPAAQASAAGVPSCDAAAFGTRDADPVSDAEEGAPLGAEAAALMAGGGDDEMGEGVVGGGGGVYRKRQRQGLVEAVGATGGAGAIGEDGGKRQRS